jgi:hypothetical protein
MLSQIRLQYEAGFEDGLQQTGPQRISTRC